MLTFKWSNTQTSVIQMTNKNTFIRYLFDDIEVQKQKFSTVSVLCTKVSAFCHFSISLVSTKSIELRTNI